MVKISKDKIIVVSVISIIITVAGILTGIILTQTEVKFGYSLIGKTKYIYDSDNVSTLDLTIFNAEGSLFISYEEDMENTFEAENRFFGKKSAVIEDSTNFTESEVEETMFISFEAPAIYNTSDDRSFYNNLHIKIRADIIVKYNITTDTGDIYLVFDSVLTQTIIAQLNVFSNKGDVSVHFGDNTAVNSTTLNTQIVSGALDINFEAIQLYSTIDIWNITSYDGSIDLHIDQSEIINIYNATLNIETDTGRVSMRYKFNDDTGFQVSAITSTGDITSDVIIPGPFTPYENAIFPATENYIFSFKAGTGSIRIKELVF